MSFPGWSTTVFLFCDSCSWVTCWSCCSSEKSSSSCTFFGFPASSAYLNPFQQWLYDFEIHLFTLRTIEGLIHNYYKRWNMYWCSRRQHNALRAGGVNFWTGWWCANTGLQKLHKYLRFPEDKISTIYPDHAIQNVYTPPALNASCCLLEHQYMFSPFVIVMHKSLNCPQC